MQFPLLSDEVRLRRLQLPLHKVHIVLDTDAYNEIDDQFAIAYALACNERIDVEAIYAAPFYNPRSTGPQDGMEKSYEEILYILDLLRIQPDHFVCRGSPGFLRNWQMPYRSEAALDLIERALGYPPDTPLYVVAIGAITNVASAILIEPEIINHIVVIWVGAQPLYWPHAKDFNLLQDPQAARLILDCGVPLVQIPCAGVASKMLITIPEIEHHVEGYSLIGNYLADIFKNYHAAYAPSADRDTWSKVIWDIVTIAYLVNNTWVPTEVIHSPVLTQELRWQPDPTRHLIHFAKTVNRDAIFEDFFKKLANGTEPMTFMDR
ncbi:MAG: nucleoside hydrolase [Anaerolineae bacterium]|nr:nucleoside hydrolase [Anaerolineae bacterium]